MDGKLLLLTFLLIGFKYIRRFTYWSVSQLRLMYLPWGQPEHPSRLESYFKWTAKREGRACCEGGGGKKNRGGGDYFSRFLIQEVKLAGARAKRKAGRRGGRGRGLGGAGTDGLFTKGSGATGMLYISSVSCPDFPTYRREQRGEGEERTGQYMLTRFGRGECNVLK